MDTATSHPQLQQQQDAQPSPSQMQMQYTTVGSIYNPSPQPLQPPTRRGRTVKSFYPQYKPDPPLASHHYSPLQQNSDRAVSPHRPERFLLPAANMAVAQSPAPAKTAIALDKHDDADTDQGPDDTDSDTNLKAMGMNFKSLTNLASYPNPMQKAAQKVLSSHRPQPISTSAADPYQHSLVPSYQPQNSDNLAVSTTGRVRHGNLQSVRSDPFSLAGMLQSDGIDEQADASRASALQPNAASWVPNPSRETRDTTYSAVLAKGPGAPAPLTAGPPGLRQFKSSALESTISTYQHSIRRSQELDNDLSTAIPYHTRMSAQPSSLVARQSTPSQQGESTTVARAFQNTDTSNPRRPKPIVNTLTVDEISQFYPEGFPQDIEKHHQPISPFWQYDYQCPLEDRYWTQQCMSFWEERAAQVDSDFYAGSDMINKTISQAKSEKNRRDFARLMGHVHEPERNPGKVINRKLAIEEASVIPTEEHAAPLLSMALQTFLNHPEFSSHTKLPKYERHHY